VNTQHIRVIHVDDDRSFIETAKCILEDEGPFRIEIANSVDEALTKITSSTYDVIISDYEMPNKNGLHFLKELKTLGNVTPFILFTGKGREEVVVDALNFGADRYIDKHGDPRVVYAELSAGIRQLHEKTQATRLLWESEERFKKIITNFKDIIMLTETDGTVIYISPSVKNVLGYDPSEIIGTKPRSKVYIEDAEKMRIAADRVLTEPGFNGTSEYRFLNKQGNPIWLSHTYFQIIENDKIKQVVSIIKDISEQKKAKEDLSESEAKFSAAFHSSGVAICFTRVNDGLIIDANESFLNLFDYTREEMIGKKVDDLHLYAGKNDRQQVITEGLSNRAVKKIELKGRRKNGTLISTLFSTQLIKLKEENHFLTTLIDIPALKKTQEALLLRQKDIKEFMTLIPNAVTLTDKEGNIVHSNELAGKGFGIPNDEVVGMNALDFVIESEHEEILQNLKAATESDRVITQTFHGKRRNGKIFSVDGSAKAMRDECGNVIGFMIVTRDITEKMNNEKRIRELLAESEKRELKLKESEERYRFVAEHAIDIITVTDVNGVFKYVSPSVKNVLGLEPADLIGKRSVIDLLSPETVKHLNPKMAQLVQTGELPPQQFSIDTMKGKVWLETSVSIVRDEAGQMTFNAISRDITQKKKNQEELDRALSHAKLLLEKLSVVGGFVRHDVRNKLTNIANSLYLYRKQTEKNQEMDPHIERISIAITEINRILEFSQTYEAVGSRGLSWIKVADALKEAQILSSISKTPIITNSLNFEVLADSALNEIFHNFIDNSIKYGGAHLSKITVSAQMGENCELRIIYEDDGDGIDPEIKPRLFEKGAGKGSGLGLYLISRICNVYGWRVFEEGVHGTGVRFVLVIPAQMNRRI